ncbi:MAG TPA: FAD-dependent oxidoreductase [Caulobacteraceae bacterium]|nr:FAD-dependent oxidoreductase [Caulobacteraceae bacterium]
MIAWRLACEGCDVVLIDAAPMADNASGMAAGMLAPAFEAALGGAMRNCFPLLKAARDCWPAVVERLDAEIGFRRSGAAWIDLAGERPQIETHAAELAAIGAVTETWDEPASRVRLGLPRTIRGPALFTPEDWRLDPPAALTALRRAAIEKGARVLTDHVVGFARGRVHLSGKESFAADRLIVATGFSRSDLAPEMAALSPIKGQLLCFPGLGVADDRPVLRTALGYAAFGIGGLRVGATMEVGADDRAVDAASIEPFVRLSQALVPAEACTAFKPEAGVRAATPDGLPLVGRSATSGVYLATGARRNGWLLAPLVAEITAAYLAGRDPGPFAKHLAPNRCLEEEATCRVSG